MKRGKNGGSPPPPEETLGSDGMIEVQEVKEPPSVVPASASPLTAVRFSFREIADLVISSNWNFRGSKLSKRKRERNRKKRSRNNITKNDVKDLGALLQPSILTSGESGRISQGSNPPVPPSSSTIIPSSTVTTITTATTEEKKRKSQEKHRPKTSNKNRKKYVDESDEDSEWENDDYDNEDSFVENTRHSSKRARLTKDMNKITNSTTSAEACDDEEDLTDDDSDEIMAKGQRKNANKENLKCKCCTYAAASTFDLRRHQMTHLTQHAFACHHCDMEVSGWNAFRKHNGKLHGRERFECPYCKTKTVSENADNAFSHYATCFLKANPDVLHKLENPDASPVTRIGGNGRTKHTYSCKICCKSFRSRVVYSNHQIQNLTKHVFTCHHCDFKPIGWHYYRHHNKIEHAEAGLQCPYCKIKFVKGCLEHYALCFFEHNKDVLRDLENPDAHTIYKCSPVQEKVACNGEEETNEESDEESEEESDEESNKEMNEVEQSTNHEASTTFCKICNREFGVRYFKIHLMTHLNDHTFSCNYCDAQPFGWNSFKQHIRTKHADKGPQCPICKTRYETLHIAFGRYIQCFFKEHPHILNRLLNPSQEDKNGLPGSQSHPLSECPKCNVSFSGLKSLVIQKHLDNGCDAFKCKICNLQTYSKEALSIHMYIHNFGHHCKICNRSFRRLQELKLHLMSHLKSYVFTCHICHGPSIGWKEHVAHVRNHNMSTLQCPMCHKTEKSSRFTHYAECFFKQNEEVYLKLINPGHEKKTVKSYKCHVCPTKYDTSDELIVHWEKYHGLKGLNKCRVCGQRFALMSELLQHRRMPNCNVRKYKCRMCHSSFNTTLLRRKHMASSHRAQQQRSKKNRMCYICKTTPFLRTLATREFHMILHHSNLDSIEKAQKIADVNTWGTNRIFFRDEYEVQEYSKAMWTHGQKCKSCDITFLTLDDLEKHFSMYHMEDHAMLRKQKKTLASPFLASTNITWDEKVQQLYNLHNNMIPVMNHIDKKHKLYHLLLTEVELSPELISKWRESETNQEVFFHYVGGASVGINFMLVSPHHSSAINGLVCTNEIVKLKPALKAYLIREDWIEMEEGMTALETQKKAEALRILKLLMFYKRYRDGKQDTFFQNLESAPLCEYLRNVNILKEMEQEVEDCGGNLFKLKGFEPTCLKKININSEKVSDEHVEFAWCEKCKNNDPFLSPFYRKLHDIKHHSKEMKDLCATDQIIQLRYKKMGDILKILKTIPECDLYSSYSVVGLKEKVSCSKVWDLVRNSKKTPFYQGSSSGRIIAKYHFANSNRHTALNKMERDGLHLYKIVHHTFPSAEEMRKFELAVIIIESIRKIKPGEDTVLEIMNQFLQTYDIPRVFTRDQWRNVIDFALTEKSMIFSDDLPFPFLEMKRKTKTVKVDTNYFQ